MDVEIKLQGFAELAAALREMPANIERNALKAAVAAAGRIVRDQAKDNIGRGGDMPQSLTGTLKRSLYVKYIRERSSASQATYFVGARMAYNRLTGFGSRGVKAYGKYDAFYAKLVEFGHYSRASQFSDIKSRRQRIAAKRAALASGKIHWINGKPFLRPAFEMRKEDAINVMAAKLRERLERYRVQGK